MADKKPHLSRRYYGWKTKTTNGDLCKYRVYEIMGTGRKNEQRTFVVQSLILTSEPSGYLANHHISTKQALARGLLPFYAEHTAISLSQGAYSPSVHLPCAQFRHI